MKSRAHSLEGQHMGRTAAQNLSSGGASFYTVHSHIGDKVQGLQDNIFQTGLDVPG